MCILIWDFSVGKQAEFTTSKHGKDNSKTEEKGNIKDLWVFPEVTLLHADEVRPGNERGLRGCYQAVRVGELDATRSSCV